MPPSRSRSPWMAILRRGKTCRWSSCRKAQTPDQLMRVSPLWRRPMTEFLYLMGDVVDSNIVSGKHDVNYWNEDPLEFYPNATGDLGLTNYVQGVAQLTAPCPERRKDTRDSRDRGRQWRSCGGSPWPPKSLSGVGRWKQPCRFMYSLWSITPAHGQTLGSQVHLNGASEADRNLKLIWSWLDGNDTSYQNPSVFGQLIFIKTGPQTGPSSSRRPPLPQLPPLPAPEASAPYANPSLSVDERVDDLLQRMSLPEKLGQMTLVEKNSISFEDVGQYFIGGVLSGGGGFPSSNTVGGWFKMVNRYQRFALQTRLNIPRIYGVDAVHGHNNLAGAVIFPHQIGLGAANDPELMERIGRVTAEDELSPRAFTGIMRPWLRYPRIFAGANPMRVMERIPIWSPASRSFSSKARRGSDQRAGHGDAQTLHWRRYNPPVDHQRLQARPGRHQYG